MDQAVKKVQKKELSLHKAAKLYGILASTLHRHVHGSPQLRVGRPTILTYNEEKEIVYACQVYIINHVKYKKHPASVLDM